MDPIADGETQTMEVPMGTTVLQIEYTHLSVTCRFTKRSGGYFRWKRLVDEFHAALVAAAEHLELNGLVAPDARLGTGRPIQVPVPVFRRAIRAYRKLPVVQSAEAEGGLEVEGVRALIHNLQSLKQRSGGTEE